MNGRKWDGPAENSSFQRKRIKSKKIQCTSIYTHTSMDDKSDDSDIDPESVPRVTVDDSKKVIKRTANWEKDIAEKKLGRKRQKLSDDPSDDEFPKQSSGSNPLSNPQILPSGSEKIFENPLSIDSEILPNIPGPSRSPQDSEELVFSHPPLITTVTDSSASSIDLISVRNLDQLLQVIHDPDHLPQEPISINNSDISSIKKSSFKPSYVFRNLLYTTNSDEAEEFSCEQRIFQPNFPMDVLSEDQHILRDLRNVFECEDKLKDSTSQTETLNVQQTVDKDVFQNPSDQDNQDCYDWDKFLERWEDLHIVSESTTKAQHHEHNIMEEREDCVPAKRSTKRKESTSHFVPFNGQAKKLSRIVDSPETTASTSSKSTSPEKEHSSSHEFFLKPFEEEMKMIVHPDSLDVSETSTASKLEKFIKNTKIKLLDNNQIPPFTKKFISLCHESLPNRTNGSLLSSDSYNAILQDDLFKNQIHVEENITSGTNISTEKIEELTGEEGDDSGDIEMVS